jgi:hypothetical protein
MSCVFLKGGLTEVEGRGVTEVARTGSSIVAVDSVKERRELESSL